MYVKFVFIITSIICGCHVIFQSYLLFKYDFKESLNDCDLNSRIFRIIGLHNLTHLGVLNITRLFIADFIVLILTLIFFVITQRIFDSTTQRLEERLVNNDENDPIDHHSNESSNHDATYSEFYNKFKFPIDLSTSKAIQTKVKLLRLKQITKYFFKIFFLVVLGSCGILNPSILSFSYFFLLIFILTWFGFNKKFSSFYVYLRILICVFSALHVITLFLYQFEDVNDKLKSDEFVARLLGLTQYIKIECKPYYNEKIPVLNWNIYLHPILLCTLYLTTVYMIKYHFKAQKEKVI